MESLNCFNYFNNTESQLVSAITAMNIYHVSYLLRDNVLYVFAYVHIKMCPGIQKRTWIPQVFPGAGTTSGENAQVEVIKGAF